jgi:hypothetical protein
MSRAIKQVRLIEPDGTVQVDRLSLVTRGDSYVLNLYIGMEFSGFPDLMLHRHVDISVEDGGATLVLVVNPQPWGALVTWMQAVVEQVQRDYARRRAAP